MATSNERGGRQITRHERCFATIRGAATDRPPRYIPGIACDVASELLGRPVNTGTGSLRYAETCALMKGPDAHEEFVGNLFKDLAEINRALDVDVYRMPWRQPVKPTKQLDEYTFLFGNPEGNHSIWQYSSDSGEFGAIKRVSMNPPGDHLKALEASVEAAEKRIADGALENVAINSDEKLVAEKYGEEFFMVFGGGGIAVGYEEEMMMAMVLAPDLVRRLLMTQAETGLATGRALANTPYPRVLMGGGDMAGNNGPFYSPKSFREVYLPVLKYMMEGFKELGVHYVFRTDGDIWSLADMFFNEAACPGYGEVDRDAKMTVGELRKRYPNLVLWNNMSCNKLQNHSAEWVREESKRCIEESNGVGYFHGCSNAIMKGTPAENVVAMFEGI